MKAALLAALAAALAAAPRPALAFRRTCPGGDCVRWNEASVPWWLNPDRAAASAGCDGGAVAAAAQAAFAAWEDASAACGGIELPYAGTSTSIDTSLGSGAERLVVFRRGWCSEHPDAQNAPCFHDGTCSSTYNCFDDGGELDKGTLAVTMVKYTGSCIVDADIEVADWDGTAGSLSAGASGWYWTCSDPGGLPTCGTYGQSGCVYQDLQNTLTHEAGHFLGLAHPCESDVDPSTPACTSSMQPVTMYPSAPTREIQKRSLEPDDIAGVCAVYPAGFSPPYACSADSGCGCGGAPAGGLLALLGLAALAPRWRRRSR